ncbi:hypothetical protein YC2023_118563 [Brassica napus]
MHGRNEETNNTQMEHLDKTSSDDGLYKSKLIMLFGASSSDVSRGLVLEAEDEGMGKRRRKEGESEQTKGAEKEEELEDEECGRSMIFEPTHMVPNKLREKGIFYFFPGFELGFWLAYVVCLNIISAYVFGVVHQSL